MPLAIDLMAHLVDSEGCTTVLSRWDTEKTSLISDGYDRRTNLDMSIALSLSSPRVASVSGTKDLLSLLSILPDGISDLELRKSNFPIHNVLECKATLLRTSLAYISSQKRLKVLVPVREHIQRHHPAQLFIVEPLFQHYRELLELYEKHNRTMLAGIIPQITMNFANIQSLLTFRVQQEQLDHSQTIYSVIYLSNYSRLMRPGTVIPDCQPNHLVSFCGTSAITRPSRIRLLSPARFGRVAGLGALAGWHRWPTFALSPFPRLLRDIHLHHG